MSVFSHEITQYNVDTHNACTLTPYEYMYANPTPMSTSEGLSTGRSEDSRSHHWRLVVDGNVADSRSHHWRLVVDVHHWRLVVDVHHWRLVVDVHHWRLVVDGNVAYHLTCNTGKS